MKRKNRKDSDSSSSSTSLSISDSSSEAESDNSDVSNTSSASNTSQSSKSSNKSLFKNEISDIDFEIENNISRYPLRKSKHSEGFSYFGNNPRRTVSSSTTKSSTKTKTKPKPRSRVTQRNRKQEKMDISSTTPSEESDSEESDDDESSNESDTNSSSISSSNQSDSMNHSDSDSNLNSGPVSDASHSTTAKRSTISRYSMRDNRPKHSPFQFSKTKPSFHRVNRKRVHHHHHSSSSSSSSSSLSSSSSSSSSDSDSSYPHSKHYHKDSNPILPINYSSKHDALYSDTSPIGIDSSITWESIGGLKNHVTSLKEMIILPLLYPELFQHLNVQPPRGVLFVGPPGTGKTLVARALCNSCTIGGKKISFFMRKGADCLSKWVGEAEKQLRLLFEQAKKYQPSIIFFDEIDGLTPVRSSKQDQIHSSIVSTILALMDGLDSRGQVIVIGATNRVDSIDPALRRPGRFDRELYFDLPNVEGRKEILQIHTKKWKYQLPPDLLSELAEETKGYAGADLKSLCSEAALQAIHRCFPQIYESSKKLKIEEDQIQVEMKDFENALLKITPCSYRSNPQHSERLPSYLQPLLSTYQETSLSLITSLFPWNNPSFTTSIHSWPLFFLYSESLPLVDYVAKSILFSLDSCHLCQLDLLSSSHEGSLMEVLLTRIHEAYQQAPSILYIPHVHSILQLIPDFPSILQTAIHSLPSSSPVLLFLTANQDIQSMEEFTCIFDPPSTPVSFALSTSFSTSLIPFFKQLLPYLLHFEPEPSEPEPLPIIEECIEEKKPVYTEEELKHIRIKEDHYFRELRCFFRELLFSLTRNSRYRCFNEAVKEEDVPDYYEIIKNPMCFDTMFMKLENNEYFTLDSFLTDIHLIQQNAKEYNPSTPSGKRIVRAAASMVDEVDSTVYRFRKKVGYDLFERCNSAVKRREEEKREKEEKKNEVKNELSNELMEEEPAVNEPVVNEPVVSEPIVNEPVFITRTTKEEEIVDEELRKQAEDVLDTIANRLVDCDFDKLNETYLQIAHVCTQLDNEHTPIQEKIQTISQIFNK